MAHFFNHWKVVDDEQKRTHIEPEYRDYQAEIREWEKTVSTQEKELIEYILRYGSCYQLTQEEQALRRSFYTWAYLQKTTITPAQQQYFGSEDNSLTTFSVGQLRKHIADRILREHAVSY